MAPSRRALLSRLARLTAAVGVVGFPGCLDRLGGTNPGATPSPSPASRTTSPETDTPRRTTARPPTASLLPLEGDGWTRTETRGYSLSNLGVSDGTRATYLDADSERFDVVVFRMRGQFSQARPMGCEAGWQVVVEDHPLVFAASTGTSQATFTPEAPPTMDRTAVPGGETDSRAAALLARSPALTAEGVETKRVSCDTRGDSAD